MSERNQSPEEIAAHAQHLEKLKLTKELKGEGVFVGGKAGEYTGTPDEIEEQIRAKYGDASGGDEDSGLDLPSDPLERFEAVSEINKDLGETNNIDGKAAVYVGPKEVVEANRGADEKKLKEQKKEEKQKNREDRKEFMVKFFKEHSDLAKTPEDVMATYMELFKRGISSNSDYQLEYIPSILWKYQGSYYDEGIKDLPDSDDEHQNKYDFYIKDRPKIAYKELLTGAEKILSSVGDASVIKNSLVADGSFSVVYKSNDGSLKYVDIPAPNVDEVKIFVPQDEIDEANATLVRDYMINKGEDPNDHVRFRYHYDADFVTTEDGRNKYDFAKEYTMRTHMQTFEDLGLNIVKLSEEERGVLSNFYRVNSSLDHAKEVIEENERQKDTFSKVGV